MDEWPGPELKAVYDPPRVPATEEHEGVPTMVPEHELRVLNERIQRHGRELANDGIVLVPYSADGQIRYFSLDQQTAESLLRERFGAQAALKYLGASLHVLRAHPFGSWLVDGRSLHLFYGLPRNGEEFAGCVVAERKDCVLVSLSILDWLGAKTLIGGFIPCHATVTLDGELDDRNVIDNFDNRVRSHWKTAAEIPLPRPQDV